MTKNSTQVLGAPSARALASMCIALSIVIEYIWHYEEESEHNEISLTLTYSQSSPMNQNQALKYPLCKKIMLIVSAVIFSLLVGCSQFVLGFSSLD